MYNHKFIDFNKPNYLLTGNKRGLHGSVREVREPAWCVSRKYVEWYPSVEFVVNNVPNAGYHPPSGAQVVGATNLCFDSCLSWTASQAGVGWSL